MSCEPIQGVLQDYLDGELGAEKAEQVTQHLNACRACRGQAEQLSDLRELLRRKGRPEPAPVGLAVRVARSLREEAAQREHRSRRRFARTAGLAVAAALLISIGAVVLLRDPDTPAAPATQPAVSLLQIANALTTDHMNGVLARQALEPVPKDAGAAERWCSERLGMPVPLPAFSKNDFELRGGEVRFLLNRPAARLDYVRGDESLSLFVLDGENLGVGGCRQPSALCNGRRGKGVRCQGRRCCNVVCWKRRGLFYALVGQSAEADLRKAVEAALPEP